MITSESKQLTERQQRELEYHRKHSEQFQYIVNSKLDLDLIEGKNRRWWNHYWEMYTHFASLDLKNKKVLVSGCGFGHDVLSLAYMGAEVTGTDLSPESINIAEQRAKNLGLSNATFVVAPCERLPFPDHSFDICLFFDILHHVDIPLAMAEAKRVLKPRGRLIIGEPYTHSVVQRTFRKNAIVEKLIYPALKKFIYQTNNPYITEDERKLDERELESLLSSLTIDYESYFYVVVQRLIPARYVPIAKLDRLLTNSIGTFGKVAAGRFLISGTIK